MDPTLTRALEARQDDRVREFVGEHCVLGSSLVVPLRVVWRSYYLYCCEQGYHADADPAAVRRVFEAAPWATLRSRHKGLIRTAVHGVGLRATAPIPTSGG